MHPMIGKPNVQFYRNRQYVSNRFVLDCDSSEVSAFLVFELRHLKDLVTAEDS